MILNDKTILRKTTKLIEADKEISEQEKEKRIKLVEDIIKIKDRTNLIHSNSFI